MTEEALKKLTEILTELQRNTSRLNDELRKLTR